MVTSEKPVSRYVPGSSVIAPSFARRMSVPPWASTTLNRRRFNPGFISTFEPRAYSA